MKENQCAILFTQIFTSLLLKKIVFFSDSHLLTAADTMKENCIIVGNTVTRICTVPMPPPAGNDMMCNTNVAVIPPQHLTIGGAISTANIIMASWSRQMWQSVFNRAIRMLPSGPIGSKFATASAVVSGN
ncbi:hypothetical protein KIN20_021070 [Parelaphostrongylus tenuis]|uniref:Uncharacterized protein n=1 Tax=Parelaphostrongylus tenuis TaxID=148309 RepID=A0AAD5QRB0_PARTN|nr:hypothetical protein KIN20_021070 [Parelaphostrongylus tenuis]